MAKPGLPTAWCCGMGIPALVATCGGCVAMSLPPAITPDVAAPLPLRVTTDAQHIAAGLERANVFAEVVHFDGKHAATAPAADLRLTARPAGDSFGPPIPVVTMLTLGLIPTIVVERAGWELTFTPVARPDETVTCRYVYEHTAVIGLLGTLLSLDRAHYTTESATAHPRFFDHLEHTIREHAPALMASAGRTQQARPDAPQSVAAAKHEAAAGDRARRD